MTEAIYIQTGVMLFTAAVIIWTVITVSNIKRYNTMRDEYYTKRLNSIESMLKKDLGELVKSLKK